MAIYLSTQAYGGWGEWSALIALVLFIGICADAIRRQVKE